MASRRRAREFALHALYTVDLSECDGGEALDNLWAGQIDAEGLGSRPAEGEEKALTKKVSPPTSFRTRATKKAQIRAKRPRRVPALNRAAVPSGSQASTVYFETRSTCVARRAVEPLPASVSLSQSPSRSRRSTTFGLASMPTRSTIRPRFSAVP